MALHYDLPIYKVASDLLQTVITAQIQMPRLVKRHLGDKICDHCVAMLNLLAMANATQAADRARHLEAFRVRHRATQVLLRACVDCKFMSPELWGECIQALDSLGRQSGGWLKSTSPRSPAPAA